MKTKRDVASKKTLAAAGKRIREEIRRYMTRKQGTALAQRVMRAIEAE